MENKSLKSFLSDLDYQDRINQFAKRYEKKPFFGPVRTAKKINKEFANDLFTFVFRGVEYEASVKHVHYMHIPTMIKINVKRVK